MYDRTLLRCAAASRGDHTASDLSRRLMVAHATGWRLWTGKNAPSARLAARVEAIYGLPAAGLLQPSRTESTGAAA